MGDQFFTDAACATAKVDDSGVGLAVLFYEFRANFGIWVSHRVHHLLIVFGENVVVRIDWLLMEVTVVVQLILHCHQLIHG